MPAPRFHIEAELSAGSRVELPRTVAHHARHVLRLREGDSIVLFDGRGGEYAARLVAGRHAAAEVLAFLAVERESPLRVTLVQALVATEKLDWIVEKATELGVTRVVLTPCARSVPRLQGDRVARRVDHLRQTAIAACCQCGRNRIPRIDAAVSLEAALTKAADADFRLILDPSAASSHADIPQHSASAVAVGPEGGFDADELHLAESFGWQRRRLGPRILRTETAGLAALASLQSCFGDLW